MSPSPQDVSIKGSWSDDRKSPDQKALESGCWTQCRSCKQKPEQLELQGNDGRHQLSQSTALGA